MPNPRIIYPRTRIYVISMTPNLAREWWEVNQNDIINRFHRDSLNLVDTGNQLLFLKVESDHHYETHYRNEELSNKVIYMIVKESDEMTYRRAFRPTFKRLAKQHVARVRYV